MFPDPSQAARPDLMVSDSDVKQGGPRPKRRRIRRLWYIAPVALVMLLIADIGIFGYCTAMGAPPTGVTFRFMPLRDYTAPPLDVYACVETSCTLLTIEGWELHSVSYGTRDRHSVADVSRWGVTVRAPMLTSSEPVTVRLKVTAQTGDPVFDSTAIVEPRKVQPNGPFCPPTAYVATVIATSDGRLVQHLDPEN
jgi:hypothetical protein